MLKNSFRLERDLIVNIEDFDTPVKLFQCEENLNEWNCKAGALVILVEDESKCFEIDCWFVFERDSRLLTGDYTDTVCPETFAEVSWDAIVTGSRIVKENKDLLLEQLNEA